MTDTNTAPNIDQRPNIWCRSIENFCPALGVYDISVFLTQNIMQQHLKHIFCYFDFISQKTAAHYFLIIILAYQNSVVRSSK